MGEELQPKKRILSISDSRVQKLRESDERFNHVCKMVGDIEYHLSTDTYNFFISTFIGQMLSNKAADAIYGRLAKLCHGTVNPSNVDILFDDEIRSIGISAQKLGYIRSFTDDILNNRIDIDRIAELDDDQALHELKKIKGVGDWSSKMYLLFVLDRQNILPYEDVAFLQGYEWMSGTRDINTLFKDAEKWQPFSSLVARFLYKALDGGFTKKPLSIRQ